MRLSMILASVLSVTAMSQAADWPQWRGPDRNEISVETNIQTKFADGSPKLLWTYKNAGNGYSGPAVVGNVLYSLGADQQEFAFALNTETGQEIWRTTLGKTFQNGWGGGPRSTPTIANDRLYLIRGEGDIHCLTAKDGKELWKKSFKQDFDGRLMGPGWGFSESPLVDGNKVICTPGGDGSVVALDAETGNQIWRCKDLKDSASYSSVIAATVFGVKQYIQMTEGGVAGISADDGKLLWYYKRPVRTAGIPTPIFHNNYVFSTAGYGVGCDLIKLSRVGDKFEAEKVYANKNMVNHHGGVVLYKDHLYGFSDGKGWVCMDFLTGEINWEAKSQGNPKKGSLTCAAGHLFCFDESTGTLHVAEASPNAWVETGKISLPEKSKIRSQRGKIWTHPVIANGKLYLRDQDLLFCFDVRK